MVLSEIIKLMQLLWKFHPLFLHTTRAGKLSFFCEVEGEYLFTSCMCINYFVNYLTQYLCKGFGVMACKLWDWLNALGLLFRKRATEGFDAYCSGILYQFACHFSSFLVAIFLFSFNLR